MNRLPTAIMYACNHGLATCSMASMRGMHTRQGTCACSSANMHTYPVARTASGVLWALTLHVDAAPPARRARRACFYPAASAYLPCRAKKHARRARRRGVPAGHEMPARSTRHAHSACARPTSIHTRRARPRTCGMRAFVIVFMRSPTDERFLRQFYTDLTNRLWEGCHR